MMSSLASMSLELVQNGNIVCIEEAVALLHHYLREENMLVPGRSAHKFSFEEFQPAVVIANFLGEFNELKFGGRQDGIDCVLTGSINRLRMEISSAKDGQLDALQFEHINRYGTVSIYDRVMRTGTKRKGKLLEQADGDARCWQTELAPELLKMMHNCVKNKILKSRTRPLYDNAYLAVVIDDYKYAPTKGTKVAKLTCCAFGFNFSRGSASILTNIRCWCERSVPF